MRLSRARLDARLVAGVAIVLASVVGVVALVLALDRTTTAWAAPQDLVAGDVVRLGDLQPRPVRLDLAEGAYLVGDQDPDQELVVLRPIGAGELVPAAALADVSALDSAVVVVPVDGPLASGLVAGASVDVWAAAPDDGNGFAAPAVLVPGAEIGRVVEEGSLIGGAGLAVEVVVPQDRVARVLEALADGASISLVPALPRGDPDAESGTESEPEPSPTSTGG